jgi:hypothetical protein
VSKTIQDKSETLFLSHLLPVPVDFNHFVGRTMGGLRGIGTSFTNPS